jgi:5-methylthioribose kinase
MNLAIPRRDGPAIGGAGYAPLDEAGLRAFLAAAPGAAPLLGGAPESWSVREVGDGNLNLVFIVKGAAGGLVVKQALPYVRLVGESWPLPLERAFFEHEALAAEAALVPHLVPRVHHFDPVRAAIVMELLEPHIILRKGLIRGTRYPRLAEDIATFAAEVLFRTSDLGAPAAEKRARQALFSANTALCKITEDLVFTDPTGSPSSTAGRARNSTAPPPRSARTRR